MKHEHVTHDAALLLARAVVGASIAAHGAQKLLGWFGGPGPQAAGQMFGSLGFKPGDQIARLASVTEIASGVLIATGAGGPIGPMLLTSVMATAVGSVHFKNGYWNVNQGFEMNTMYALLALLLAVEDHGHFSLDEAVGIRQRMHPGFGWLALAGGIAAGAFMLSRREQQKPQKQPASATEIGTLGEPAENITPATQ